jgi:cytochrome c2
MKEFHLIKVAFAVLAIGGLAGLCAAAEGDVAKGKTVAEQCEACHDLKGSEKKMGPPLKGLFKKDKLNNGGKVTDANVLKVINEGGNGMPAYADLLTAEEKTDLLAFLKTL